MTTTVPVQSPTCRMALWDAFHSCVRRDGRLLTVTDITAHVECWEEARRQLIAMAADYERCPDCDEATLAPDDHKCPNPDCPSHDVYRETRP